MKATQRRYIEQLVAMMLHAAEAFLTEAQVIELLALGHFNKPFAYVIKRVGAPVQDNYVRTSTLAAGALIYTVGSTVGSQAAFKYAVELVWRASDYEGADDE